MKRNFIAAFIALTAIAITFLLFYRVETQVIKPVQDGVILITVHIEADQLVMSIKNNGSTTIDFDADFEVQAKRGNGWVNYFRPEAIPAIGCELAPGKSTVKNVAFASSMSLKKGDTYRIIKDFDGIYYASEEFIA